MPTCKLIYTFKFLAAFIRLAILKRILLPFLSYSFEITLIKSPLLKMIITIIIKLQNSIITLSTISKTSSTFNKR